MVLTADEAAHLAALQAKAAEPEVVPAAVKVVKVPGDVLDVVRQLVQVHFAQISPEVYTVFLTAVADAQDDEPAVPAGEEEPATPAGTAGKQSTRKG
jgi:hypothetical protein